MTCRGSKVFIRVAAALRDPPADDPPAGRVLTALANVPDRQRSSGLPQPVMWGKRPWLVSRRQAVPVVSRWWDEIGEPVKELKRRQFDHAIGSQPHGLPVSVWVRPSWRPCAWGARSGHGRCGRLRRGSSRAAWVPRVAGRHTAGSFCQPPTMRPDSATLRADGRKTLLQRERQAFQERPFGARKTEPSAHEPLTSSESVADMTLAGLFFCS